MPDDQWGTPVEHTSESQVSALHNIPQSYQLVEWMASEENESDIFVLVTRLRLLRLVSPALNITIHQSQVEGGEGEEWRVGYAEKSDGGLPSHVISNLEFSRPRSILHASRSIDISRLPIS